MTIQAAEKSLFTVQIEAICSEFCGAETEGCLLMIQNSFFGR